MTREKIMICCDESRREEFTHRARQLYGDWAELVSDLSEEPDKLLVAGELTLQMHRIMAEARLYHIPVLRVDEHFCAQELLYRMMTEV